MAELLKNLLDKNYISRISRDAKKYHKTFKSKDFEKAIINSTWKNRELKQRITHVSQTLQEFLPNEYPRALKILLQMGPQFTGLEGILFPEFISTFGMSPKYRKISLQALEELTQYSSSEFAVRPFILQDPVSMMKWMAKLSKRKNYHSRRLASEGCRPRLPWAPALPEFKRDPRLILPILENLKDDPQLYVRKSVANNINDLCKDNPEIALILIKTWMKKTPSENTRWIITHGLRSLIKEGHSEALALIGYKKNPQVELSRMKLSHKKINVGENLQFQAKLKNKSKQSQNCMIDYLIYHYKKNGEHRPKVFKLKKLVLKPGETLDLNKVHKFQRINTRKYYTGKHFIQIQINGSKQQKIAFHLND